MELIRLRGTTIMLNLRVRRPVLHHNATVHLHQSDRIAAIPLQKALAAAVHLPEVHPADLAEAIPLQEVPLPVQVVVRLRDQVEVHHQDQAATHHRDREDAVKLTTPLVNHRYRTACKLNRFICTINL